MKKLIAFLGISIFGISSMALANDETNKKILKDALQGAVTGTAAATATADSPGADAGKSAEAKDEKKHKEKKAKNFGHKNKKEKKRPHGWDMGKKTGWGGGDEPPGHSKNR